MKVSTKELRTHTEQPFKCLEGGEKVTLTYRGKVKGIISGVKSDQNVCSSDYFIFGVWADRVETADVDAYVRDRRKPRF